MKTAMIMFILMTSSAMAETLTNCHSMSKNPRCREIESARNDTQANVCRSYEACTKIKTVDFINNGQAKASYTCSDFNNKNFDCSKLVEIYGTNLYGLGVKLKVNSFDTCHTLGACGQRACIEENYAFVDSKCEGNVDYQTFSTTKL